MQTINKMLVFEDRKCDKMYHEVVSLFPHNVGHINCMIMASARERAEWEMATPAKLVLMEDTI